MKTRQGDGSFVLAKSKKGGEKLKNEEQRDVLMKLTRQKNRPSVFVTGKKE